MNFFRQRLAQIFKQEKIVARFNFKTHTTPNLGTIRRPEIEVQIWSETYHEWQRVVMVVDTGADYTLLPRYIAHLSGVNLRRAKRIETIGVGGVQKVFFVPEVLIKIGNAERKIPVGFVDSNQVPPLLGRQTAFESFVTVFNRQKDLFFAE